MAVSNLKFEMNFGSGFVPVDQPLNYQAIQIELIWTSLNPSATLQSITFEWGGSTAKKINDYFKAGLTGGAGIFEALATRITVCTSPLIVIDTALALPLPATEFECDIVKCPIAKSGDTDWFEERAGGFSFKFLSSLGVGAPGRIVPANDYKLVPYVLSEIPDYTQAMIIGVSLFITIKELYDATTKLIQWINQLSADIVTLAASVGIFSANVIADLINVVLYLIYLFLIIFALIVMIITLFDNIIQRKKYKAAMRIEDCFKRGCEYMGLTFQSSIFQSGIYKDATVMPKKMVIPDPNNPLTVFQRPEDESDNFPNNAEVHGHPDQTFLEFVNEMKIAFNAEGKVVGNKYIFEEKHAFLNVAAYTLPNIGEPGYTYNYPAPFGTNASELKANTIVSFQIDESDRNTLHNFRGNNCEITLSPNVIINQKNVMLSGLDRIAIPYALAKRKEHLTLPETLLDFVISNLFNFVNFVTGNINGLINVINNVISVVGGSGFSIPTIPALPANIINNRIGWLLLSNDSFVIPKMFIGVQVGSDWEIHQFNEVNMSGNMLMQLFHGKNLATRGNQWLLYKDKTFPFCCKDYVIIVNNNVFTTADGNKGKFERLIWDIHNERAINVDYRVNTNFTNNLKEQISIDGN